jgi:putative membrane protein
MVKPLSPQDKQSIAQAIAEAERPTEAEIVAVIAPASDAYQSYIFLYGLIAGSLIATGLWAGKILTGFPLLLAVQLGAIALLTRVPWLHGLCLRLVPRRIRHLRAAHRAYEEYLSVSRNLPASIPIVLLYVSLAEHYMHILPSRAVRGKIPGEKWNAVIGEFTASMATKGLRDAYIGAVRHMAELLTPHFPSRDETNRVSDQVIEIRS